MNEYEICSVNGSFKCVNELELIEKSIELFKKAGGKVGYKVPRLEEEKFFSFPNGKFYRVGCINSKFGFALDDEGRIEEEKEEDAD